MRSENDTWDITTSVGSTALFVAAARALEAQKPEPLAVDPYADVFCRAVGGEWADLLDGKAPDHQLKTEFGEHFVDYLAARTKYFDEYFGAASEDGVRQVVILAAGLDSRAYRLPWPDGTVIYELDRPQILEFKRKVLARRGDTPNAERREIAVDLRDDWSKALADRGFDASKPSAWIAEGLLIYLPSAAQHKLFGGIHSLAASGSHLALEEGAPLDADEFRARVEAARADDDGRGEWFQLVYNEQHAPAAQWFRERGWTTSATPLTEHLRSLGRPLPGPESESATMVDRICLVSARRG